MKQGPISEHIQNVCGRINYAHEIRLDNPWKLLGMAVLLQGALDVLNGWKDYVSLPGKKPCLKVGADYFLTYQSYADLVGLEISADEFLRIVSEQLSTKKRKTRTAAEFFYSYI